jgi:hypothetical protein
MGWQKWRHHRAILAVSLSPRPASLQYNSKSKKLDAVGSLLANFEGIHDTSHSSNHLK